MSDTRRRCAYAALSVTLVAAIAVACSDMSSPERADVYEWRLITTSAVGSPGLDTLAFHWPRASLPVRIWVEDTLGLPDHLRAGIARWKRVFLYREFDAEVVSDSSAADVIVRGAAAPTGVIGPGTVPGPTAARHRIRLHSMLAPECQGATDLDISPDNTELVLPIRTYLEPRFATTDPGLPACLALTATHELGHAMGLFQHSPHPDDLMYADPGIEGPSDRDRETAERAYHLPPNLSPVTRR
ncbi:MAG: hypothetical protein H0W67_06295 [Gemmatimonadales bacterium]|nr:hypothetical protein [Gemmatimonadales bacterium]